MHLKNYTQPAHQRFIIRICFMVPIYAICSWLSLLHRPASLYLDTFRDCYESWVVYNFLNLCLAYVGGPGNVVNRMAGKEVEPSCWAMTCCLPPLPIDGVYIRRCRQGAIQFVLLKPILAGLTMLLTWGGVYGDNEIEADKAYPYITFVYNMSYTLALYALLLFYLGAHDLLKPYKPVMKFVLVKSVIFLTFWQSIVCAILVSDGVLETGADGRALQNVLICVEMIIAAPFMLLAFPWSPYTGMGTKGMFNNISHAISIDDVVSDTVHQFAPTYQEYVLHGTEGGPTRKIRLKTHVMMGQEMRDARRWNGGEARGAPPGGAPPRAHSERLEAGMLANAGFENSYGEREVEDDLEDEFGQELGWDSDSDYGGGAATGTRGGGVRGGPERAPSLSPLPGMAPLPSEARRGGATVFDAVVDLTRGPASVERAHRASGTADASPQASPLPAPFLVADPEPGLAGEAFPAGAAPAAAPIAPPPAFRPAPSLAPPPRGHDFASFEAVPPKNGDDAV